MEIKSLTQEDTDLYLTEQGQSNVSGNFTTLREGKMPTPRTPLYKGLTETEVFDKWLTTLSRWAQIPEYERLVEYDKSRMTKVGPQGGYPPFDDRKNDLYDYYNLPQNGNLPIDMEIVEEIRSELFGVTRDRRPLSFETVLERDKLDDKLTTNSGAPDVGPKSSVAIQQKALQDAKSGKWKLYPMITGSRSQRGKYRFIFWAAFSLTLVEKSFLYPLMDTIRAKKIPFFSAWEGFDSVELGFEEEEFFYDGSIYVQQDYESMDKTINKTHQSIFVLIVGPFFQRKYQLELEELMEHVFRVEFMYALDKVITGRHGMPSGSGFTNFLESIITYYVWKLNVKNGLPIFAAQGLGDDAAFSLKGKGTPGSDLEGIDFSYTQLDEDLSSLVQVTLSDSSASIGLIVQPEKQLVDDRTTLYLQRFFDVDLTNDTGMVLGMYPSILAINTALNPERFHDARKWSKEMEILRWIMILENCINLPYIDDLIQFFVEGDKYKLGLVLPEFFVSLPSLYEDSKAIRGFVPSYNQESIDRGIYDFGVVKKLLKLRSELN